MSLIVRSKVKAALKGMRTSGDIYEALDKKVDEVLKKAAIRAKANGRVTVRAADL
jgi:histone H3/H4